VADENPQPSTDTIETKSETTTLPEGGLAKAIQTPEKSGGLAEAIQARPQGAPESYQTWKVPDGYELDKGVIEEASPIFKELNLTQEQSQKLVDLYAKHSIKSAEDLHKGTQEFWEKTRADWRSELKRDDTVGKLLDANGNFGPQSKLVQTVNQALDGLQDPKLVSGFKDAMEFTGAGDNPHFVKVLYALAKQVTEGREYVRGEPARPNGGPRSAAAAMYPNLPSEADRR
jgi:hypothetical protein